MIGKPTTGRVPQRDTRKEVLGIARTLMQTRSFLGFSFQDIADAVGLRKASLYHHFPTKEALGVEVLRDSLQAFDDWTRREVRTPRQSVEAFFDVYRNLLHAGQRLCPAAAVVAGWDSVDETMRQAVLALRDAQVGWLTGILDELRPAQRPNAELALFIYSNCQGALQTARMTGRVEDFDTIIAQLRASLDL